MEHCAPTREPGKLDGNARCPCQSRPTLYAAAVTPRLALPMKRLFARKLRLRPSIVALFVLLTVPVFLTSVAVT